MSEFKKKFRVTMLMGCLIFFSGLGNADDHQEKRFDDAMAGYEKASIKKLIEYIESRLEVGEYKDSVHKIKLITTREMILEIISK